MINKKSNYEYACKNLKKIASANRNSRKKGGERRKCSSSMKREGKVGEDKK